MMIKSVISNRELRHLFIFFVAFTLLPFLFNAFIMWIEIGSGTIYSVLDGSYECRLGVPCHPLRAISLGVGAWSVGLAAIATIGIYLAMELVILRFSRLLSKSSTILLSISVAAMYRFVAGFMMPIVWLSAFNDYLLGVPVSSVANEASWYFVFPFAIVLVALMVTKVGPEALQG